MNQDDRIWTVLTPQDYCKHCTLHKDYHVDGCCPFEATMFEPYDVTQIKTEWVTLNPTEAHKWVTVSNSGALNDDPPKRKPKNKGPQCFRPNHLDFAFTANNRRGNMSMGSASSIRRTSNRSRGK